MEIFSGGVIVEGQILFNIIATMAGFLGLFILKYVFDVIKELRTKTSENQTKILELALKVAEGYVPNPHFQSTLDKVFTKLDQISQKIDQKMDKH